MYTFNMLDYAEMYRNERMREAANNRRWAETPLMVPTNIVVLLGEMLTDLGGVLTALGTDLAGNRSA